VSQIIPAGPSLRERKRLATHARIADEAARLATDRGLAATTVEEIAAAADIGRATFFRYFDAKETAIAEGFSIPWLTLLVEQLELQPAELGPVEAVAATFAGFAGSFEDDVRRVVLLQARMSQASPGLQAWTLRIYVRFEQAIAEAIAPRFPDLSPGDLRPRLVGAVTMSAVRLCVGAWLDSDGEADLPAMLQDTLGRVEIP
jgi:AcrR family transcriptional regulator